MRKRFGIHSIRNIEFDTIWYYLKVDEPRWFPWWSSLALFDQAFKITPEQIAEINPVAQSIYAEVYDYD